MELTQPILKDLILKLHDSVIVTAKNIVYRQDIAEDIAMITWQTVWERKDRFDSIDKVKAFLHIAAKNMAITYMKGKRIRDNIELKANDQDQVLEIQSKYDAYDVRVKAIELVSRRFSNKYAHVLIETIDGKTSTEIGKELGISASTVTSMRSLIVSYLRLELRG